MKRIVSLTALALFSTFSGASPLAIVGARLEASPGKVIENATIVIDGDRIISVGSGVTAPSGATIVDAKGKYVYAGFIDGYTLRGMKLPETQNQTPRTATNSAPATMWEENRKGIRAHIKTAEHLDIPAILEDCHKAGITTAFFNTGSGTIRGAGSVAPIIDGTVTGTTFGMELSFRGGGGGGYPGSLMGIVALLRQTFLDTLYATQYPPDKPDVTYTSLAPLLAGKVPAIFQADTEADIVRAISLGEEFKFAVILKGARDAYKRADWLATKKISVISDIAVGTEPKTTTTEDGPPVQVLEERLANWKLRASGPSKLAAAGVRFAITSDGDSLRQFLPNLRMIVKNGLSKELALKALTTDAAAILGLNDVGTVENGKKANLVIASGDLFDDQTKIEHVFVLGKQFKYEGK